MTTRLNSDRIVEVHALVRTVDARLDTGPSDYADWSVIASQLETAARKARAARDAAFTAGMGRDGT